MKIVKDHEIEQIIDTHKDYKIQSTVSDVLERFSAKQTSKIFENPAKPKRKHLVIGTLIGSISGLAIAGVSIFVVYNTQQNQTIRTNISSNSAFLEDQEKAQVLGKELLLFSMTKNNEQADSKSISAETLGLNKQSLGMLDNNIYGHIIAGFENIAPIIFNQISSFDSIVNKVYKLENPTTIGKVSFKNRYESDYNSLKFSYYYNADGSTDYGVTRIGKEFYKTHIYEIKKGSLTKTEIYLEGIDNSTLFKIAEDEGTNAFVYQEFNNQDDVNKNKYSFYYDVDLGNGFEPSSFKIKSYDRYEIDYKDILLKDILKILFNVDYTDIASKFKYNYDNCYCSDINNNSTEYLIGSQKITL